MSHRQISHVNEDTMKTQIRATPEINTKAAFLQPQPLHLKSSSMATLPDPAR